MATPVAILVMKNVQVCSVSQSNKVVALVLLIRNQVVDGFSYNSEVVFLFRKQTIFVIITV